MKIRSLSESKTYLKMLPVSFLAYLFKRFRCFTTANIESVDQRVAKLLSVKSENGLIPGGVKAGPNVLADFFLRPPNLTGM